VYFRHSRRGMGRGGKAAARQTSAGPYFEVLEQLGNPLSLLGRTVLQQIKLAP
jgi:hypothetical protein